MCHYDGQIIKIEQNWPHFLSGWFLTKLWTKTWYAFLSLTLKNARKLRKLAKFSLEVREPRKSLGKMTKNVVWKSKIFPRKWINFWWSANREKICQVVRESEKVENRWLRGNFVLQGFSKLKCPRLKRRSLQLVYLTWYSARKLFTSAISSQVIVLSMQLC